MTPNPSLYCVSVSNSVDCTVHLVLRSKSAGEKEDEMRYLYLCFKKVV